MLEASNVEFAYGSVQVLFGVDMTVQDGELLALVGTNGAGKSTLLNLLAGLAPPTGGTIELDGENVTAADAETMVARGVVLVQGGKAVFPDLTVAENLEMGMYSKRGGGRAAARERVAAVMDLFPALGQLTRRRAGTLSGGQQQQLAIAKGLLPEPRVLLIDELSLGLAPTVRDDLVAIVREMNAVGTSIVLVEQNLELAASLTERALFMEKGTVRFEGATAELLDRDDLARAVFLGSAAL